MENQHLSLLNQDLLLNILSRVDGQTLASAASTCIHLRGVAQQGSLWKQLCHATWPSTLENRAHNLISSFGGYTNFYADSFPLILYKNSIEEDPGLLQQTHVSPSDLVSLVDVYYRKKCVFSKVLYGIPGADDDVYFDDDGDEHQNGWFWDCPFRLDLLNYCSDGGTLYYDDDDDDDDDDADDGHVDGDGEDDLMGTLPSVSLAKKKDRGSAKVLCKKLEKNVRLSWVVLNTKSGKAVNLSSWRPILVQTNWPSEGDFLMRFGCAVPAEKSVLGCQSAAECIISARCRWSEREGSLRWTEISLEVEDKEGAHVSGRGSIVVLERALGCSRSRERWEVERGYEEYVREKRDLKNEREKREGLVDGVCVLGGIALFLGFCLRVV